MGSSIFGIDSNQFSAISAAASAIASFASIIVVSMFSRSSRKSKMPIVNIHYERDRLKIENIGFGALKNLRTQPNNIYMLDKKAMYNWRINKKKTSFILKPEGTSDLALVLQKRFSKEKLDDWYAHMEYTLGAGRLGKVALIYSDIFGHKYITRMRTEETQSGWKIVPYDVKSYGLFYRIWDFIGIIFYWIYYPIKVKIFGVDKLIKELEQKSTK